jgi:hypothetical protein
LKNAVQPWQAYTAKGFQRVGKILEFKLRSKTRSAVTGSGIAGLYFSGMSPQRQAQRRREMAQAGFPAILIQRLCLRSGVGK